MHVYRYMYIYICFCIFFDLCIHIYVHIYTYIYASIYIHINIYVYIFSYIYMYLHVHMYSHNNIHMYTHMCIYKCIHLRTFTHARTVNICCSVLQCVAVCCSVLQFVAVCGCACPYDVCVYIDNKHTCMQILFIHMWCTSAPSLLFFCSLSLPLPRSLSPESRLPVRVCINAYPQRTYVIIHILSTNTTGAVDSVC